MASNYKPLGEYIRQVDVRNKDRKVEKLLGLSVEKCFIPSIANTIGTDMAGYKVIQPRQFAYVADTSRRGDKIGIALLEDNENAIVSSIYTIFEITDEMLLLPEYLMMWFRRPEFDRYARFHSHGSAREVFDWQEMCDMRLPVPPLSEQRRIVERYASVSRRIACLRRLIATLDDTARTIYRHTFVDGINKEQLPEGWRMGKLGEVADFCYGKMRDKSKTGNVPVFSGYGIVGGTDKAMFDKQHIVMIARGDSGSGKVVLSPSTFFLTNLAIAVLLHNDAMKHYLYLYLTEADTYSLRSGSAQAQVTINNLSSFDVLIPPLGLCKSFDKTVGAFDNYKQTLSREISCLTSLQSLLLTRISQ